MLNAFCRYAICLWLLVLIGCGGGGPATQPSATMHSQSPLVSSLVPATVVAGSPSFTLTVNGSGFVQGSVVQWNGSNRTTAFVSASQLTAEIAAADVITNSTVQVTVVNPSGAGGASNAMAFAITGNSVPVISSISPATVIVGTPNVTLTVSGSGFVAGASVQLNGVNQVTSFVDSATLQATLTTAQLSSPTTLPVRVVNPSPGGGASNTVILTVANPGPTLTSFSPASLPAASSSVAGTLTGTGFVPGMTLQWISNTGTVTLSNVSVTSSTQATLNFTFTPANVVPLSITGTVIGTVQLTATNPQTGPSNAITINALASGEGFPQTFVTTGGAAAASADLRFLEVGPTTGYYPYTGSCSLYDSCFGAPSGCTPQTIPVCIAPDGTDLSGYFLDQITQDARYALLDNGSNVYLRDTCLNGPVDCAPATFLLGDYQNVKLSGVPRYFVYSVTGSHVASQIFLGDTCIGAPAGCSPASTFVAEGTGNDFYTLNPFFDISSTGRFIIVGHDRYDLCNGAPSGCVPSQVTVLFDGSGNALNFPVSDEVISPDARYIAYYFSPNDGGTRDLYFTDTCLGAGAGCTPTTSAIALSDPMNIQEFPGPMSMTPDGRYVAFDSLLNTLVPLDTNGRNIFLADTCAGAPAGCSPSITRLSVNADGVQGDGYSGQPHISSDGRWVVYTSSSTDLAQGVTVSPSNSTNVLRVRTPVP